MIDKKILTTLKPKNCELKVKPVKKYYYKNKQTIKHTYYLIYYPDHYGRSNDEFFLYDLVYVSSDPNA
jgi:hypothetical protein